MAQNGNPPETSGPYIEMIDSFNARWIDFGQPNTESIKGTQDLQTTINSLVAKA